VFGTVATLEFTSLQGASVTQTCLVSILKSHLAVPFLKKSEQCSIAMLKAFTPVHTAYNPLTSHTLALPTHVFLPYNQYFACLCYSFFFSPPSSLCWGSQTGWLFQRLQNIPGNRLQTKNRPQPLSPWLIPLSNVFWSNRRTFFPNPLAAPTG